MRRAISKACSRSRSTTRDGASSVCRARSARKEAALLRRARRRAALRQRDQGASRRAPPGTARSISTASKAICRSATILAPEHDLPRRPQAASRATGCAWQTAGSRTGKYWDVESFDTDTRSTAEIAERSRRHCCAGPSASGSRAKSRSARSCRAASIPAWSCPTWPKRWSRSAGDDVGRVRQKRDTTSWTRRRSPRAHFNTRHFADRSSRGSTTCSIGSSARSTSRSPTRRRFRRTTCHSGRGGT